MQENMSESQTLKPMIHEVAHSMLHNKEVEQDEQGDVPIQALFSFS